MNSALILVSIEENVVKDITLCETVEEMESRFAKCVMDHGVEPTDVDFENGYWESEDGISYCMNTAYKSDEEMPIFKDGYNSEELQNG